MIVAYKFGVRCNGELSPKEGLKVHWLHADDNNGKVLFTTYKGPAPANRDKIKEIILTTADGSYALIAQVDSLSKFDLMPPPGGYTVPSLWNHEKKDGLTWFALSDVRKITNGIKTGDYTCVTGKDLLDSLSGTAYMVYVN